MTGMFENVEHDVRAAANASQMLAATFDRYQECLRHGDYAMAEIMRQAAHNALDALLDHLLAAAARLTKIN